MERSDGFIAVEETKLGIRHNAAKICIIINQQNRGKYRHCKSRPIYYDASHMCIVGSIRSFSSWNFKFHLTTIICDCTHLVLAIARLR